MSAKKLDWNKAKFDGIKGYLVPTGEDIDPREEEKLQAWHAAKKGIRPRPEPPEPPIRRDKRTLDLPTPIDRTNPVKSINEQVRLREERRKKRERYIARGADKPTKPSG